MTDLKHNITNTTPIRAVNNNSADTLTEKTGFFVELFLQIDLVFDPELGRFKVLIRSIVVRFCVTNDKI